MIWARRFIGVSVSLVFIFLFVVFMLLLRANATLLSPDFMNDQLRQADVFTFVYEGVAPLVAEEQIQGLEDLPFGIQLSATTAISAAREILPPEWIQAKMEHVVGETLPYATGRTDEFVINIPVKDRVIGATETVKRLIRDSGVYAVVSSQEFEDAADQALQEFGELPLGIILRGEDLAWAAQQIIPPAWLQEQVEGAVDEAIAYLTYDTADLNITIPLPDRVRAALPVVKELLVRADAYDGMVTEVTREVVEENIAELTFLPIEVSIEAQEVIGAIADVLPPEWLQEQVEAALDDFVIYMTGEAGSFAIVVPLADRIEIALQALKELADRKMKEVFAGYPACSVEQAVDIARSLQQGSLPACQIPPFELDEVVNLFGVPSGTEVTWETLESVAGFNLVALRDGVSVDAVAQTFGIDLDGLVRDFIGQQLPDVYTFTEEDLRAFFPHTEAETFDSFRETVINGFIINEDLFREQLDSNQFRQFQDVRQTIRDGFSYSSADFREDLGQEDPALLETLETARSSLGTFDSLKFVVYIIWVVLLAGIGFLGGRQWWSRLAWAGLPLAVGGLLLFIAAGPLYSSFAEPELDKRLEQVKKNAEGLEVILIDKISDVGKTAAEGFLSGIKTSSLIIAIIGFAVFLGAFLWGVVLSPRRGATF